MRICQVVAGHGEGGLEKHVRELSVDLANAGHEVCVLGDSRLLDTLPQQVRQIPVPIHLGRRNPILLMNLLTRLRACRCDVIHAQASKAAGLMASLKPWLPCPVVGTLHNIKHDLRAFHKLDHVIAVSRQLAHAFEPDRVSVVYNGIDATQPERIDLRKSFSLPADRPVLCSVGRLVHAKGYDILLDAIDGLAVSLVIVGEGEARAALERRIARMASVTQVRLTGYREDARRLMASADGVVISSRREGYSYVCAEALMSGVRLVSTDVPVANEMLPANLIVPLEDVSALREKLGILLADPPAWDEALRAPWLLARRIMNRETMRAHTCVVYAGLSKGRANALSKMATD